VQVQLGGLDGETLQPRAAVLVGCAPGVVISGEADAVTRADQDAVSVTRSARLVVPIGSA